MQEKIMTVIKKVAKVLLTICSAPLIMIAVLLAMYGSFIIGIIHLLSNHGKTVETAPRQAPEAIPKLVLEDSNLAPMIG